MLFSSRRFSLDRGHQDDVIVTRSLFKKQFQYFTSGLFAEVR